MHTLMKTPVADTIPVSERRYCAVVEQSLSEIYRDSDFVLSFELFPPKSDKGMADLKKNLEPMLEYGPDFVTCTFGAGGGRRDRTLQTLAEVATMYDGPLATHLTCVGMSVDAIREYLQQAKEQGIRFVVAIRGDNPPNGPGFRPDGFRYGNELVEFIRNEFPGFGIVVGGYPEVHPESISADSDIDFLKRKVEAGADVIVTQLFYANDDFFRFRDRCDRAGITVPVVPGLLPVSSYAQLKFIVSLCGANVPNTFESALQNHENDPEAQFEIGVKHAIHQALELEEAGIPGMHFYVLNKCQATIRVLESLGRSTDMVTEH